MLLSLSLALSFASSDVLGLFRVACRHNVRFRLADISQYRTYLETASDIVGVLVPAGLGCCLYFAAVLGVIEDLARMLLGLLGCVYRPSVEGNSHR